MSNDRSRTDLLILSAADVRQTLTMKECIGIIEHAMRTVSCGGASLPLRIGATIAGGHNVLAVMPGYLEDPPSAGAKVIAVYPDNPRQGLSSHMGVVALFDPSRGVPVAIVDAAAVTALRTAAASAVATNALALPDAADLAILGTGEQAAAHVSAIAQVRQLRSIRVWGRSPQKARAFAEHEGAINGIPITPVATVEEAVEQATIICTTTSSREPILEGMWVRPGAHVNLVGASSAQAREANESLVVKASFFVDLRASALVQAGELLEATGAFARQHIRGEIGEVLNGTVRGRRTADEITIYKSLGIAAQDLAVAHFVYTRARESGRGVRAEL